MLTGQLGKMPNRMLIEGHTDLQPFAASVGGYSNWELFGRSRQFSPETHAGKRAD
jgi:hypothetical protein